jgi:hypothetical protein
MHTVELYAQVRRYVAADGHSRREAAKTFGISRDMVAKMMRHAMPCRQATGDQRRQLVRNSTPS